MGLKHAQRGSLESGAVEIMDRHRRRFRHPVKTTVVQDFAAQAVIVLEKPLFVWARRQHQIFPSFSRNDYIMVAAFGIPSLLSEAAVVRLRGESSNTFFETLADWEEQLKGFEFHINSELDGQKCEEDCSAASALVSPEVQP
ncbi:hypothetical protein [uncultured Roseobacter sp.]|uniref:hypothetical protein n=1 Tax=uncultured Roseobacter sp. TaxID=114847 RepID=UPI002614E312|nr:hypothetical protein [uncultured Roseobacter sp.]